MKSERVILSFVAVLIGLAVAGASFYIYEHYFKNTPPPTQTVTVSKTVTPTPDTTNDYMTIDKPADESVFTTHTLQFSGKATKGTTIVVETPVSTAVGVTSADGNFSLSTTIDDDTNLLEITAIFPDGTEKHTTLTETYSTETF
jgi:hypothetical protein